MNHRPELDGIRAFAVLGVVGCHSFVALFAGGWLGVDVFFVLSGYLITTILLGERERTGTIDIGRFWVRRLLRLVPAFAFVLLLGAFFYQALGAGGTLLGYLGTAGAAGLYVENFVVVLTGHEPGRFGHTWSLAVEMQFYLLWPLVLAWLLRTGRRLVPWVCAAIASSFVLFIVFIGWTAKDVLPASYYLPWCRGWELLIGALVAIRLANRPAPDPVGRPGRRWTGWVLLVAMGVLVLVADAWWMFADQKALLWQAPIAVGLTALLLLHLDRVRTTGVGALLAWRPVAWLGSISYCVYLVHYPVVWVIGRYRLFGDSSTLFPAVLVISVAIAAFSMKYIEKPALGLKDRLSTKPSPSAANSASGQAQPTA
ncbi:acyltransferase family protein [Marmoricola sp. RAF53]|uniref:acyltransferase family protein n=1 Tax=Marmoricola sp. RAF53 TaxID=3233059 RepID=UPI003F95F400